jgi:DNA polymerase elongation subunit (family B)
MRNVLDFRTPKILTLDIETSLMEAYVFSCGETYITPEDIVEGTDWSILSFSAKWAGSKEVIYDDVSKQRNWRNDKRLVKNLVSLIDEADIIISQNGKRFDIPKVKARMQFHDMEPLNEKFVHVDVLQINKKHFKHTSNKLAYITAKFCKKFKKSGHKKFPGKQLWIECQKGNKAAWAEMRDYNQIDVLSLEEYYFDYLQPWDSSINYDLYHQDMTKTCSCGSVSFRKAGVRLTKLGAYQRYRCNHCGQTHTDSANMFSVEKRRSIKR